MRESWVDYAKGIGIILVVFGHVNRGLYNAGTYLSEKSFHIIDNFIYSFHMPLFFFLSGLFFTQSIERRGKKEFIISKIDTIIYPYIVWSLIQGCIEVFLSQYTNNKTNLSTVLSLLWEPRAQFWFLYALFMVFVFSAIIYNKNIFVNFLPHLVILFLIINIFRDQITEKYHINYLTKNLFFFFLGIIAHNFFSKPSTFENKLTSVILFIALTSFQYVFLEIQHKTPVDVDLESTVLSTVGIMFITSISRTLSNINLPILKIIGEMSMNIYVMHIIAGSGVRIILSKVGHTHNWYIHAIVGVTFSIFIPMIATLILKKMKINFLFTRPKLKVTH